MNRVEMRRRILAENDAEAERLRARFRDPATLVIDVVSSPGAGKTTLLEATAERLGGSLRLGALVGDVATELDGDRLRRAGLHAHQIVTGGACHLDAKLVRTGLEEGGLPEVDVLFLENVGNLVCPASYALGEDFKVVLLSVTEGADKPFKYPAVFKRAGTVVLTKTDLLPHVPFDVDRALRGIHALNPGVNVLALSALTGRGMDAWCDHLRSALSAKTGTALVS